MPKMFKAAASQALDLILLIWEVPAFIVWGLWQRLK